MRIGLISDTHDKLPVITTALHYFHEQSVDLVVHCGDWKSMSTAVYFAEQAAQYAVPVRGVLGNNDMDVPAFMQLASSAPGDFQLFESVWTMPLEGPAYVAAHHGHHKPTVKRLLADEGCTILLLGHSHKPLIEHNGTTLLVNPGSMAFAIPRRKDWWPSVAIVDTGELTAEIVRLQAKGR